MENTHKKTVVLAVVALVVAAAAPTALASLTVDTETADTSPTSDWSEGTVVTDLNNESNESTIRINSTNASTDGDKFTIRATVDESGHPHNNTTFYESDANWNHRVNDDFTLNVTHSEFFDDLERDADENVTVEVEVVWNETGNDEESATFHIYADENENTSVIYAADGTDDVEYLSDKNKSLLPASVYDALGLSGEGSVKVTDQIDVTENTTTLRVELAGDNSTGALSAAYDEGENGSLSSLSYVVVEGTLVPVFTESADADWLDTDSETYAVIGESGNDITIHNLDEMGETGTVDVEATGNEKVGFFNTQAMLRDRGAGVVATATAAASAADTNGDPWEDS